MPVGAIVGGTIGGVILVVLVTLLGLYLFWRRDPTDKEDDQHVSIYKYWSNLYNQCNRMHHFFFYIGSRCNEYRNLFADDWLNASIYPITFIYAAWYACVQSCQSHVLGMYTIVHSYSSHLYPLSRMIYIMYALFQLCLSFSLSVVWPIWCISYLKYNYVVLSRVWHTCISIMAYFTYTLTITRYIHVLHKCTKLMLVHINTVTPMCVCCIWVLHTCSF